MGCRLTYEEHVGLMMNLYRIELEDLFKLTMSARYAAQHELPDVFWPLME